ncbi:MAG TPA: S9 family peptidase [Ktedonobacteraceae bacterium]|nr:S9 family peptidase [Ktedonobacteraceae bacterium]
MLDNNDTPTVQRRTSESAGQHEGAVAQAVPVQAIAAQPFMSVEDLLQLQIPGDPRLSPNGRQIVFTIQASDKQANRSLSSIWLAATDRGHQPQQITSGEHYDTSPRWSPDGTTLAFLSDRAGPSQIFLLPMEGGEARQLTHLSQGVSEFSWRPDGQAFLVHAAWKPQDDQEASDNNETSIVYTRLDEAWDGIGFKQGRHQQLWLTTLAGQTTRLTAEPVDLVESSWSPDGKEIVFSANRRPDPDLSVSRALWVYNFELQEMRRLTPEEGLAQLPNWSPDGEVIAYYYSNDQTETSNISPWIVNPHGPTTPRPATPDSLEITCMQGIVDEIHGIMLAPLQWYPDSKELLATVQQRGQVHLHRLNLIEQKRKPLTTGNGLYLSPQISRDGQTIVMVRVDWFTPGDIWLMDGNGENLHKLTGINDGLLHSRQVIRPRRLSWQGSNGLEIEGWLYLPPLAPGAKAPLILEVHGGPSLAWADSYVHEFQVLAGKGFAVLAANPRGSLGYGEEFCRASIHDWGGEDYKDLMAGIDYVIANEPVDGERLGIGGLSYGGFMTNWAITQSTRFKAAVSRNGISSLSSSGLLSDQTLWFNMIMNKEEGGKELQESRSPLTYVDRVQTPLLLLHSQNDLRCPTSESLQFFISLRRLQKPVELVLFPGVGHLIDWPGVGSPRQREERLQRTVSWFEKYL